MARRPRRPAAVATDVAAATATAPSPAQADAAGGSVTVRMYRGMLGDCFLLTINHPTRQYSVLIDCGILQNVQGGAAMTAADETAPGRLPDDVIAAAAVSGMLGLDKVVGTKDQAALVVNDIFATLRSRAGSNGRPTLDVLAVTHEHYDHLSGFTLNWDQWQSPELDIKQLWMAWTENPTDQGSIAVKQALGAKEKAVRLAAKATAAIPADAMGLRGTMAQQEIEGLLAFLGPEAGDSLAADGGRKTNADTLAMLKRKAGDNAIRYLEPGMVIEVDRPEAKTKALGPGLRTYVLGPPRNIDRLKKDAPTKGEGKEVYLARNEMALAIGGTALRMMARHPAAGEVGDHALGAAPAAPVDADLMKASSDSPFARPHHQPYIYDGLNPDGDLPQLPGESVNRWAMRMLYERGRHQDDQRMAANRRIDGEWVAGAEALAMKLDSDTNNTSLVLAFELPDADRRVLLFAADAQVGNWLSWGDQGYPAEPKAGETQQAVDQLLARTVFYKVGHHGSHNATARDRGLKLMTHPELTAAIPVVEAVARIQGPGKKTPGKGWHMPYEPMYEDLKHRTKGRIVRGDGDPAMEAKAFENGPATVAYADDGLWVELTWRF